MSIQIGIPKETIAGESRVAATPETVGKLIALGCTVLVENGAGTKASFFDSEYEKKGAILSGHDKVFRSQIVAKVQPPNGEEIEAIAEGSTFVGMLSPFSEDFTIMSEIFRRKSVSAISLELIPRITRAQNMDVLSSQANIAGYRAVIEGASCLPKLFPMMMTAAGSVPPARVFVLGVGVAGLQAIATARRLGAQVEAFDVRPEVREQIQSVGAKFLDLKLNESGAGSGGYAQALSAQGQEAQQAALAREAARADMIITTAQIPGKRAPVLLTENAIKAMKPGSVVVDLAASSGGNCPLTVADEITLAHGVYLIGWTNYPSMVATHASQFFARNLFNLLELLIKKDESGPSINWDFSDEIIDSVTTVHGGEIRWPREKKGVR